jgi:hypothetical protein
MEQGMSEDEAAAAVRTSVREGRKLCCAADERRSAQARAALPVTVTLPAVEEGVCNVLVLEGMGDDEFSNPLADKILKHSAWGSAWARHARETCIKIGENTTDHCTPDWRPSQRSPIARPDRWTYSSDSAAMSGEFTERENLMIGSSAATIECLCLQPTLYAKNAMALGWPLTLNPMVLYRGIGASLANEVGQMSLQFLFAGALKARLGSEREMLAAAAGGAIVAVVASPLELLMIQQQSYGGGLVGTVRGIVRDHGLAASGLYRGLIPCIARDSIYVGGMLGVTPVVQRQLLDSTSLSTAQASLAASAVGGIFGGVVSHPFDVVKTCMQGDLERASYGSMLGTARTLLAQGGLRRLFSGVFFRTVNITGTVYIANECCARLPPAFGIKPAASAPAGGAPSLS